MLSPEAPTLLLSKAAEGGRRGGQIFPRPQGLRGLITPNASSSRGSVNTFVFFLRYYYCYFYFILMLYLSYVLFMIIVSCPSTSYSRKIFVYL